jgi:hypothetical protein
VEKLKTILIAIIVLLVLSEASAFGQKQAESSREAASRQFAWSETSGHPSGPPRCMSPLRVFPILGLKYHCGQRCVLSPTRREQLRASEAPQTEFWPRLIPRFLTRLTRWELVNEHGEKADSTLGVRPSGFSRSQNLLPIGFNSKCPAVRVSPQRCL